MLEETIVMPIQVEQETELKSTKEQKDESEHIEALETSTGYSLIKEELRYVQTDSEVDSAPEKVSELASHPESVPINANDSTIEDDIPTSPTPLEMDESTYQSSSSPESEPTHEAVEQLLRVLSDPNLDIRMEDIEEALDTGKEVSKSKENLIDANQEFAQASDLMEKVIV
jgi:hypothetical protein